MNLKLSNTDYSLENTFSLLLCHSKMRHINMSTEQTTDTRSQFNIQNTKVGIKWSFHLCPFMSNFIDENVTDN